MQKNKRLIVITSLTVLSALTVTTSIICSSKNLFDGVVANGEAIYYHYSAVAPTGTRHGSREFWMNCSTLTPVFDQPSATIFEGSAFDSLDAFYELDSSDDRYVAPTTANPVINGSNIIYGIYPQTVLNDNSLISELNSNAVPQPNGWYKYRAEYYVKQSANPYDTAYVFDNGSTITKNKYYWFKCQPITWKVLNHTGDNYTIVSSVLLDTCYFYHEASNVVRTIDGKSVYNSNYKYSDVRPFINETFYDGAFIFGDSNIQITEVDNSKSSTSSSAGSYVCDNTFDKVFLLSYEEIRNTDYFATTGSRGCITTDYSRVRRAMYSTNSSYFHYGYYWTRSPETDGLNIRTYSVYPSGSLYGDDTSYTYQSIRPAITITVA